MICIMCVLRLRVDVIYMNCRANGEYALNVIKRLYWCNWNVLNTIMHLCVMVWWFSKVSYVNICFSLLFRFSLVGCSLLSDLSFSDSGSFGVVSWLLSFPPLSPLPSHPSLIWNILLFGFSFYKYIFKFGIGIRTRTVTTTVAIC